MARSARRLIRPDPVYFLLSSSSITQIGRIIRAPERLLERLHELQVGVLYQ